MARAGPFKMEVGNPNPTIYLQNLNEKIRPEHLKETLQSLLSPCGTIVNVVAKRRVALRGQAWIQFDSTDAARQALDSLHGKKLWGKTVVARFARYKSDAVSKADGSYETEKYHRDQERAEKARNPRLTRRQMMQQIMANPAMAAMGGMGPMMVPGQMPSAAAPNSDMQLPNKILFIQAIPSGTTQDALNGLFQRLPGFIEVREVPGRPDLAFVEFEGEAQAAMARNLTDNTEIGQGRIRVTFARR